MTHEVGPKRTLRILAIGDSITLGMGVQRTADVWPNKLESMLRSNNLGPVEVINSGVQGWNLLKYNETNELVPAEFTAFIRQMGPALKPDIVIYCICLNDVPSSVGELFNSDNLKNKSRFFTLSEKTREWFKRKALYRGVRDIYREFRFATLDFSGAATATLKPEHWTLVSNEISRLKKEVEAINATLYCVIVPYSFQLLDANKDLLKVNDSWKECLRNNGIEFKDIGPLIGRTSILKYYSLGDYIHLNAKGHELIAQQAFELLHSRLPAHEASKEE